MNGNNRLAEAATRLTHSGIIDVREGLMPGQLHVELPAVRPPQPPQPHRSVQIGRYYKLTEYACKNGSIRQVPMLLNR